MVFNVNGIQSGYQTVSGLVKKDGPLLKPSLPERETTLSTKLQSSSSEIYLAQLNSATAGAKTPQKPVDKQSTDNNQKNTPLLSAVKEGDIKTVKLLLDRGMNVNIPNNTGLTALTIAVLNNHVEIVRLLLNRGADVNAASDLGQTALMIAAPNNHIEITKLLLSRTPDIYAKDYFGETVFDCKLTPEMKAILETFKKENKSLATQRRPENDKSRIRKLDIALMKAAKKGEIEKISRLIEQGADVNAGDQKGIIVIGPSMPFMSDYGPVSVGSTPLIQATLFGQTETVKFLLEHGADIELSDGIDTALMQAARRGHSEIVKLLLDHGANINASCGTALKRAAASGHTETARLLLERGADIHIGWSFGCSTALHDAAVWGQTEVVKLLLDHGADVNERDSYNDTALIIAVGERHPESVKFLLEHGADINAKNKEGNTPLNIAARAGYDEIVKLLINQQKIDIEAKDNFYGGYTALMRAALNSQIKTVKILLDRGANINMKTTEFGSNVLMTLAWEGKTKTIAFLLDHGADVNARDKDGNTALIFAVENDHPEYVERGDQLKTVKLLIKRGADINAKNKAGDTALMIAIKRGNTQMIKLLKNQGKESFWDKINPFD